MTGRAGGYCSGSAVPGSANTFAGRSGGFGWARNRPAWGQGFGLGRRGWRDMVQTTGLAGRLRGSGFGLQGQTDPAAEKNLLQNRAATLQSELDLINSRLQAIDTEKSAD